MSQLLFGKSAVPNPEEPEVHEVETGGEEYDWEIKKEKFPIKRILPVIVVAALIIAAAASVYAIIKNVSKNKKGPDIVTISTLQEIVNVSKFSTVKCVYNGSAKVDNGKKTDYHVSYSSVISIGIDFDKIKFEDDPDAKIIYVDLPEPYITDVFVDIESLDFIFVNKKANKLSVTQTAYEKCKEDARAECEANDKMFELARRSIEDAVRALTQPIVDEFFDGYGEIVFREG